MTSKAQRAAELAAILSTEMHEGASATTMARVGAVVHAPRQVAADALALLRIGASVSNWAARYCNGQGSEWRSYPNGTGAYVWTEKDDAAKDRADARALERASEIAARYGATVEIGGDPRGFVLRLVLASGRTNTMGNDGWGVA